MAINDETKEKLKAIGLKYAETISAEAVEALFEIINVLIADSDTKIDDMFLPAIESLKPIILEFVDMIDKEEKPEA